MKIYNEEGFTEEAVCKNRPRANRVWQPTTLNDYPLSEDAALSIPSTLATAAHHSRYNRDTDHACLPAKAGTWRFIEQLNFSWVWKCRHT